MARRVSLILRLRFTVETHISQAFRSRRALRESYAPDNAFGVRIQRFGQPMFGSLPSRIEEAEEKNEKVVARADARLVAAYSLYRVELVEPSLCFLFSFF